MFWRAAGHVASTLGTLEFSEFGLETYRSDESRTKRESRPVVRGGRLSHPTDAKFLEFADANAGFFANKNDTLQEYTSLTESRHACLIVKKRGSRHSSFRPREKEIRVSSPPSRACFHAKRLSILSRRVGFSAWWTWSARRPWSTTAPST